MLFLAGRVFFVGDEGDTFFSWMLFLVGEEGDAIFRWTSWAFLLEMRWMLLWLFLAGLYF